MPFKSYFMPSKYWGRLKREHNRLRLTWYRRGYKPEEISRQEEAKFESWGLDYGTAEDRLNEALAAFGADPFNHRHGEDSVHWLLFAALGLSGRPIRRILEIGTFRGKTARLLSELFPDAEVFTCELPADDPLMRGSFRRESDEEFREYMDKRNFHLDRENITLVEANSFFLPAHIDGTLDLIWVDGGHVYPEVAWDIAQCWHLLSPGGLMLCDDVFTDPKGGDEWSADQTHDVLQYLADRVPGLKLDYFLKRENPNWSADPRHRKFVTMLEKP